MNSMSGGKINNPINTQRHSNSNSPYISVIILSYNYGHYLMRALEAIARQDFRDFEIVFVDDCSTDNSVALLKQFCEVHPNISVIPVLLQRNSGISVATRKGVEAANGQYLMIHGADDWMDDNTLRLVSDAAKTVDADRVISAYRDVDDQGRIVQERLLGQKPVHWLYGMQHASLYRADIYKQESITGSTLWDDAETSFHFSAFTERVAYVFSPCYNYLVHLDSTSRKRGIYKKLLEDEYYSFGAFLDSCMAYLPTKISSDYDYAVYQLVRQYYSVIFTNLRDAPLAGKMDCYNHLHTILSKHIPDYLCTRKRALKDRYALRPYARKVALLASFFERLHIMKIGLIGYHILSHFLYFLD